MIYMHLMCISHFSKDWATQFYYDVASDEVYVAVEESRREEALRCLRKFPSDVCNIVDPWQSSYEPGMGIQMGGQQCQMELCPGGRICNAHSRHCFLFSGSVINRELGITVAQALDPGDKIEIRFESDSAVVHEVIVGRCRETFETLQRRDGAKLTADLALLELDTDRCSVGNTIWWPFRAEHTAYRIKICKDQQIPDDTRVMILDRNGEFQNGCIRRTCLTDCGLHDVMGLCISENELVSVTQPGDAGALVMSLPNNENDVVYVYGIVIGICREPNGKSLTIASSLWKVVHEISTNENYARELIDGTQNIDFACL